MIDIHCHILPQMDDGPDDVEEAVQMALMAERSGTRTIIATPHFLNGVYAVEPEKIDKKVDRFARVLEHRNIHVRILRGAEIRISHDTALMINQGTLPSLGGSNFFLLELPSTFIKQGVLKVIRRMTECGTVPVIAHPERNYMISKHPELINDFISGGAMFQLTAKSVLGKNDKISLNLSKQMIQDGQAHFIASDGHDLEFRKPVIGHAFKAVKRFSDERTAQTILIENPGLILDQVLGNHPIANSEQRRLQC